MACKASPPYAVGGKCDPKPTTDLKNVEWAPSKRACLYENDGSCEAKGTCLPAPAGDTYGPCIGREGDFECPAPYTDKQTFYDNGYDDTRGCTDCGCEPPGGATCACANPSCGVGMHGSPDCKPPWIVTVPANNTCTPFAVSNNGLSGFLLNAKVTAPGTCKPWAVTPTGGVSPKGKRTVCCLP